MTEILIKTDYKFAYNEPDYQIHIDQYDSDENFSLRNLELNCSAGQDNSTDIALVKETIKRFNTNENKKINWLDLGCGGGAFILDANSFDETDICVGLDGSCGVYKQNNWKSDKNKKILKHADLTKYFSVCDENENQIKFDVITCWEVIEHFEKNQLDQFFKNVYNHLDDNGIFFGSIALFSDTRDEKGYHQDHPNFNPNGKLYILHKTVHQSREPWDLIMSKYFNILEYNFNVRLRNHHNSYYFMCSKKV
jgi:cyclopropane fatty-acyl-phospholipid synthase-like methyltransferase